MFFYVHFRSPNAQSLTHCHVQNRRYWDETETGNYIVPSRTSILETLPRIVSNPPRLTPKSTIGAFENVFLQIRNFGTHHTYYSIIVLIGAVGGLFYLLRNPTVVRNALGRNGSGYFHLPVDEKATNMGWGNGTNAGQKAD